ncbi:hypothetical protein GUJ93_ZPchr0012g20113 [Zizania palustris]|uniref:Uncharacterized protein n=1 Tax=Zizania palustris TaxID=103762 RepID=A0A8J5WSJ5_ZIZPA|nr:hypothetical protein GUJ93_ZPchr0012g20113 [Zizania palustris]
MDVIYCFAKSFRNGRLFGLEISCPAIVRTDTGGRKIVAAIDKVLKWEMELGGITLHMLTSSIRKELKLSSTEYGVCWVFDKNLGEEVNVRSEQHMVELIETYKTEMRCEIVVGVFDSLDLEIDIDALFLILVVHPPI